MDLMELMQTDAPFPGSYAPADVGFLLKRMTLRPVDLPERERMMQSGQRHYSEMIGPEDRPGRERVAIFRACLASNSTRLASDLCALADALIADAAPVGEVTLVSIARAGTPIGALLIRLLRRRAAARGWASESVRHYSLSIIRDRGLDLNALSWIADRHPLESVRFVDGWTGKGTIATELKSSIGADERFRAFANLSDLWAPLDICGAAAWSASEEDYVIPSSLLGGTISGLISRSVLPRDRIGSADFHGCVELPHLRRYDLSRWFVEKMDALCQQIPPLPDAGQPPPTLNAPERAARLEFTRRFIDETRRAYGVRDPHRIKIGIGESVRVALRRLPERILLRDDAGQDAEIILRLAALRAIPIERCPTLPYASVAIIAEAVA
jgi:hypothetical protein